MIAATAACVALYRPLWLVYGAVASAPLGTRDPARPREPHRRRALFLLAGAAWTARCLATGASPVAPTPLTLPFVLFLLAVLPGLLVAEDLFAVLKRVVTLSFLLPVFSMMVVEGRARALRTIFALLALTGAVEGLIALWHAVLGPPVLSADGLERQRGTFGHPNSLGFFMALALPAAAVLLLETRARARPRPGRRRGDPHRSRALAVARRPRRGGGRDGDAPRGPALSGGSRSPASSPSSPWSRSRRSARSVMSRPSRTSSSASARRPARTTRTGRPSCGRGRPR